MENSLEKQNISELAAGVFEETLKRSANEQSSRLDELAEEEAEPESDESEDELAAKARQRLEEEKAKAVLTRKEWDKDFDQAQFFVEEPQLPALQSEKQEVQGKKQRELRCGKIMWASIAFTLYAALYITLVLVQLDVERNYQYNTAMFNYVGSQQDADNFQLPNEYDYNRVLIWVGSVVPGLATQITQPESNFTGFYLNEVQYVLGDVARICFRLAQNLSATAGPYYDETYAEGLGHVRELTTDFTGVSSGFLYEFKRDGFQNRGAFCFEASFDPVEFQSAVTNLTDDRIVSERTLELSVEFVTFEASQAVHTYTSVDFGFQPDGSVSNYLYVFTMRLDMYRTRSDLVRLGFEALYVLLLLYNMFVFLRRLVDKGRRYRQWRRLEVDSLSDVERRQRHQKRPEWVRLWHSLFTYFTYFDVVYFSLALASIVLWLLYIKGAAEVDFELPPTEADAGFIPKFYRVQRLLMNYTNVVALNTIFLSVKVFDYMNKSSHMNMLSNTLYSSKEDTFYFLIIFTIFLFGFVGMAFILFGANSNEYNTIANSVTTCF